MLQSAEGEDSEINLFGLLFRAALSEHQCDKPTSCFVCKYCSEESTHAWSEVHRFGSLNDLYRGKTLRSIIAEKQWLCNEQTNTVLNAPKSWQKREPLGTSSLRAMIESEQKRRKSNVPNDLEQGRNEENPPPPPRSPQTTSLTC